MEEKMAGVQAILDAAFEVPRYNWSDVEEIDVTGQYMEVIGAIEDAVATYFDPASKKTIDLEIRRG